MYGDRCFPVAPQRVASEGSRESYRVRFSPVGPDAEVPHVECSTGDRERCASRAPTPRRVRLTYIKLPTSTRAVPHPFAPINSTVSLRLNASRQSHTMRCSRRLSGNHHHAPVLPHPTAISPKRNAIAHHVRVSFGDTISYAVSPAGVSASTFEAILIMVTGRKC